MSRYRRAKIDAVAALGALTAETVNTIALGDAVTSPVLVSSVDISYALADTVTQGATDGPVYFGLSHSDYSDADILAWIQNTGSWTEGNLASKEIASRYIRQIGVFEIEAGGTGRVSGFQDGDMVKTKLNWLLAETQFLDLWFFNAGQSALTTGMLIHAQGSANIFFK